MKGDRLLKLIIQIPCLNEAETLEIALNDLPRHIDGIDTIEYLIINDGSSDKALLDLCFDVIYHSNMKATGLGNLIALYRQWEKEKAATNPTTLETE